MLTYPREFSKLTKYLEGCKEERRATNSSIFIVSSPTSPTAMMMDKTHPDNSSRIHTSNCLYSCQKYLMNFCALFGMLPIKVEKVDGKCWAKYCWNSKESIVNLLILLVFMGLMFPVLWMLKGYASEVFGTTDYFFQMSSGMFRNLSTVAIFVANNWKASTSAKAWNKLHTLTSDSFPNFHTLTKLGFLVFLGYFIELIVHLIVMYMICFNTFNFEKPIPCIYAVQQFFPLFMVDLFIGFYSLTCWIIICGLNGIADEVESCLDRFNYRASSARNTNSRNLDSSSSNVLADLRIKHERYCEVIRLIQKSFGVQLMAIICSTTVDFIGGVYCIIGAFQGLFPEPVSNISLFSGLVMVFYGYRTLQILFFSQLITNTAKTPAYHLNLFKCQKDQESEFALEVELFLSKLANFPVELSCCDVLHLNVSFLASAASHIVTYVLVLMQFKLGTTQVDGINFNANPSE